MTLAIASDMTTANPALLAASTFCDLLDPASVAAHTAACDADRVIQVRTALARLVDARANLVAEFPAGPELDAVLAHTDRDIADLRTELAPVLAADHARNCADVAADKLTRLLAELRAAPAAHEAATTPEVHRAITATVAESTREARSQILRLRDAMPAAAKERRWCDTHAELLADGAGDAASVEHMERAWRAFADA
jgi:hypothetical protein